MASAGTRGAIEPVTAGTIVRIVELMLVAMLVREVITVGAIAPPTLNSTVFLMEDNSVETVDLRVPTELTIVSTAEVSLLTTDPTAPTAPPATDSIGATTGAATDSTVLTRGETIGMSLGTIVDISDSTPLTKADALSEMEVMTGAFWRPSVGRDFFVMQVGAARIFDPRLNATAET